MAEFVENLVTCTCLLKVGYVKFEKRFSKFLTTQTCWGPKKDVSITYTNMEFGLPMFKGLTCLTMLDYWTKMNLSNTYCDHIIMLNWVMLFEKVQNFALVMLYVAGNSIQMHFLHILIGKSGNDEFRGLIFLLSV